MGFCLARLDFDRLTVLVSGDSKFIGDQPVSAEVFAFDLRTFRFASFRELGA